MGASWLQKLNLSSLRRSSTEKPCERADTDDKEQTELSDFTETD